MTEVRRRPADVRVAVVGHVEWVDFAVVDRLPAAGEIVHAREHFAAAAGGGAVAAVQLRKLAGAASFFTTLGDDAVGGWARAALAVDHGLDLHAAPAGALPQRRAFTFLSGDHERTITVMGERHAPRFADPLDWTALAELDAVYFTGGDPDALRAARAARVLVATARALETIAAAGVQLDVLVASAHDEGERFEAADLHPAPRYTVLTAGGAGGTWRGADGTRGGWPAEPLPGPPVDAYGCGDSFAAGLTYGLGAGLAIDGALQLAARCGAHCLMGRGPYESQLTRTSQSPRSPGGASPGPGASRR